MLCFLFGKLEESMITNTVITQKFNKVVVKPEIHNSTFVHGLTKLLYMIATKFQRLTPCFLGKVTQIDSWEYCPMSGYVVN